MKVKIELRYKSKNNKWDTNTSKEVGEQTICMGDKCFTFGDKQEADRLFNNLICQINNIFEEMCLEHNPSSCFGLEKKEEVVYEIYSGIGPTGWRENKCSPHLPK